MTKSWDAFQKKHILNPRNEENARYADWNRSKWNAWLRDRVGDDYGKKGREKNSVIIASPNEVEYSNVPCLCSDQE
jgi:hypothetical protein